MLRGHRAGQPEPHRDLDQGPDLGQFGQLAVTAFEDAEAPVGDDLDGALQGELLHGLPHGGGRDAEPLAEHRCRVDLAGPQFTGDQRGAQGVEDLSAHGGTLDQGSRAGHRRFAVGVLAACRAVRLRTAGGPAPCPVRRSRLHRDPHRFGRRPRTRTHTRSCGALRAVLHGSSCGTCRYLGSLRRVVTCPSSTISAGAVSSNPEHIG
ncbi:hypothetical protein SLI_6550 [Streptomyces lividans 1326]|uniref:Uncharacterized protein n=1 Tax=Streptomyces lividans 1326 TaxID=1200984 RepID=A0A7U9DY57_STRLI|nr:hypothetical protein SLI_6550 [Streptomyces lividans 1326]